MNASASTPTVWAFDLGKGSIGEIPSPRWGEGGRIPDEVNTNPCRKFLHKASRLNLRKEKGAKAFARPIKKCARVAVVCQARSPADKFFLTRRF